MPDRIEKSVFLNAPLGRVWRAISEAHQFGAWFGVRFSGRFGPQLSLLGELTDPQHAGRKMAIRVVAMEPEARFAFRWHPHALNRPVVDEDETTLVEFFFSSEGEGTRLRIVESGFENIPLSVRDQNYNENLAGWDEESGRLARYVEGDGPVPGSIEKRITLDAPLGRVWHAIATPADFGNWFGLKFEEPEFIPGLEMHAKITEPPQYAGTPFTITVVEVVPESKLSFRWHAYEAEAGDPAPGVTTLIEFVLATRGDRTVLTVTESGFEAVPEKYRVSAFRSNDEGWGIQVENIRKYLGA